MYFEYFGAQTKVYKNWKEIQVQALRVTKVKKAFI